MKKLIILNAPPNSGKDYILENLNISFIKVCFKDRLFELAIELFQINSDVFYKLFNDRKTKEVDTNLLFVDENKLKTFCDNNGLDLSKINIKYGNYSPRQSLILTSESIIKIFYGKDYFGECLSHKIITDGVYISSDGGFVDELYPTIKTADKVLILRIFRDGCSFVNDSRTYIYKEMLDKEYSNILFLDVDNNGDIIDTCQTIINIINEVS